MIATYHLLDPAPLLRQVMTLYRDSGGFGYRQTNRLQIWRSPQDLHLDEFWAPLVERLEAAAGLPVKLLWANMLLPGQAVGPHHHATNPGPLAGVFYLTAGSPIRFAGGERVDPQPGLLLIFPADMVHEVLPAAERRVSLAVHFG